MGTLQRAPRTGPDDSAWGDYAQAIIKIRQRPTPLGEPLIEKLAPHLPFAEVSAMVSRGLEGERVSFFGPPLRVHGALQVFYIDSPSYESGDGRVYGNPIVYHAQVRRRKESFVNHPTIQKTVSDLPADQQKAAELAEDYACQHWPDELVWDDCVSVMEGHIIQPGPDYKVISQFTSWSRGQLPDLLTYDNEPTCEIIDDSLLEISVWEPSRFELSVGHLPWLGLYCALCGGGIEDKKCRFCDAVFNLPANFRSWPYSIPQLAVDAFNRLGIDLFRIDPVHARKAEHREWAKQDVVPQIPAEYLAHGKQQRSIEL